MSPSWRITALVSSRLMDPIFWGTARAYTVFHQVGGIACHVRDRHHGCSQLAEVGVSGHGLVDAVMTV